MKPKPQSNDAQVACVVVEVVVVWVEVVVFDVVVVFVVVDVVATTVIALNTHLDSPLDPPIATLLGSDALVANQ